MDQGCSLACLLPMGKIPVERDELTISKTSSSKQLKTYLNSLVGTGSRLHVAELNSCTTTCTSL